MHPSSPKARRFELGVRSFLAWAFLCVLLGQLGCSSGGAAPLGEPVVFEPAEIRCRTGDDASSADPIYDDAGWHHRARSERSWPDDQEVAWCRLRLDVPRDAPVAVHFGAIGAARVFADGDLVHDESGRWGRHASRFVHVPSSVAADGEVVLAVRLEIDRRWTYQYGPHLGNVVVGAPVDVQAAYERSRREAFQQQAPTWIASIVLAFIAAFHLVFHVRGGAFPGNLAFGVAIACVSANGLIETAYRVDLIPMFLGYRTVLLGLVGSGYVATIVALQRLFGAPRGILWAVCALFYARFAWMTWWPADAAAFSLHHTALIVAVGAGFVAWMAFRGWRADLPGARVVAVSALVLTLGPLSYLAAVTGSLPGGAAAAAWVAAGSSLAGTLGMAWAFSVERLVRSASDLQAAHDAAIRFVPVEFLSRLGRRSVSQVRRGDAAKARLTVLFLDVRGFTTLAETNPPEVVFELLNDLMDLLEPAAREHGGFLNDSTGDGFVALFTTADGAMAAAVEMQRRLAARRASGAVPEVHAGIGAHSGPVLLGTVGGSTFLTTGMVGDTVNLSARVEGLTKLYGVNVLVTSSTVSEARPTRPTREVDRVIVKGRSEPIGIHEVLDAAPDPAVEAAFEAARRSYEAGEFSAAAAAFRALPLPVAAALASRCEALVEAPPKEWDGVWRLDHK